MTHVILGHCCKDASCVQVCPQNCIHPAPGEIGFESAETLHIDPGFCIDCTACVDACPASAIKPGSELTDAETPDLQRNRGYFEQQPTMLPTPRRARFARPLGNPRSKFRIAVVGSGAAALYTVRELLQRSGSVRVTVFEKDDRIGGLLRRAVSPDHQEIRDMIRLFELPFGDDRVEVVRNTEIGVDMSITQLRTDYDAVVVACGATQPRTVDTTADTIWSDSIYQAIDILAAANRGVLDPYTPPGPRCVVIGAGNVALDVVRHLAEHSDRVREATVLSRSGPSRVAFTPSAFHDLIRLGDIDVAVDATGTLPDRGADDELGRALSGLPTGVPGTRGQPGPGADRLRVLLSFGRNVTGIAHASDYDPLSVTTDSGASFRTDSVITATGFTTGTIRGIPLAPNGTVPNRRGKIISPTTGAPLDRLYVVGWAKRGATGGVGDNRTCAAETVAQLVTDLSDTPAPADQHGSRP